MKKIHDFKQIITVIITGLLVKAGYLLKFHTKNNLDNTSTENTNPNVDFFPKINIDDFVNFFTSESLLPLFTSLIAALILSQFLTKYLIRFILSWKYVRQVILGKNAIEGLWYIEWYDKDEEFRGCELSEFIFSSDLESLQENTFYIDDKKNIQVTTSRFAAQLSEDLQCANYFEYVNSATVHHGLSFGRFLCTPNSSKPDFYESIETGIEEGYVERHKGWRIDEDLVNQFKGKKKYFFQNWFNKVEDAEKQSFEKDWKQKLLEHLFEKYQKGK